MQTNIPIGSILTGSLSEGLVMRIAPHICLEEIKTGKFVCIKAIEGKYFSLITDIKLEVTHPDILLFPPAEHEQLLNAIIRAKDIYATAVLRPMVMLDLRQQVIPVKSIPNHFSTVYEASADDIARIFGDEKDPSRKYFTIGYPLDMHTPVCLNLERLAERSTGIFGKTGTGKTFLTRLVLAGLIKNNKAVNIIFDMHSEYGLQARKEGSEIFVKGLKTLWPDKVAIFSLDPQSTRRRGGNPDVAIEFDYTTVHVDDILSLQEELNLHPTACEAAYLLAARYKKNWLIELLNHQDTLKDLACEVGAHPESIAALYRKLKAIERLPFFNQVSPNVRYSNVITRMLEYIDKGVSIIVEFGNYTSVFCYLLVANIITRAVHNAYIQKTEQFLGSRSPQDEPKKLIITIEEAHKFLNSSAARQTIFGTIAREMRKYYVSLLIVDQRPSGIDAEVLSQIGTKIIAQLSDEKDIMAVLTGSNNSVYFRTLLGSLESKKQVLLMGHAVPMPIVVQTREYDEGFYKEMMPLPHISLNKIIEELF